MGALPDGILVVCTANVCRSPIAALALRHRFGELPEHQAVPVASAGVRVTERQELCTEVAGFLPAAGWRQMASQHVALQLEPESIWEAALVVTATREQRSSVVALAPERRGAVFTLHEALWLGRDYVRDASLPAAASVTAFREHIDGMRGLRPLPEPTRWRRNRGADRDPFDIRDGHGLRASLHRGAMRAAHAAGERLAGLIAGADR